MDRDRKAAGGKKRFKFVRTVVQKANEWVGKLNDELDDDGWPIYNNPVATQASAGIEGLRDDWKLDEG